MSSSQRGAGNDGVAERILAVRKKSSGQQFEVQWRGQQQTTWEAASRMRRLYPQLVAAFEQQQPEQQPSDSAEGATDGEAADDTQQSVNAPVDSAALQRQVAELALLVKQQAQRAEEQQQHARQQQSLIEQLRASPAHSPQLSAHPSPQHSPQQHARSLAPAAAAVHAAASRRKEPRLSDLVEYNGASGDKLDAWLAELRRCARYYQLSGSDAVEFAVARLRDSADTWWAGLALEEQKAIASVESLAAALRARFQPVTTARVAREKLHALQQGGRHIDEYIAEFSKLRAQVPDMAEPDARAQFVRGLRRELALKLEDVDWESMQLSALIAKAARIGNRAAAAQLPATGRHGVNQMDVDDGDGSAGRLDRIEAALNALTSAGGGMGARTQTHRGYTQERERSDSAGRGGARSGRGGRFVPRGPPAVPGVPEQVVQRRWDAKQCLRCGEGGHNSHACPNAISASGN